MNIRKQSMNTDICPTSITAMTMGKEISYYQLLSSTYKGVTNVSNKLHKSLPAFW
jgi:hypothetical protein